MTARKKQFLSLGTVKAFSINSSNGNEIKLSYKQPTLEYNEADYTEADRVIIQRALEYGEVVLSNKEPIIPQKTWNTYINVIDDELRSVTIKLAQFHQNARSVQHNKELFAEYATSLKEFISTLENTNREEKPLILGILARIRKDLNV